MEATSTITEGLVAVPKPSLVMVTVGSVAFTEVALHSRVYSISTTFDKGQHLWVPGFHHTFEGQYATTVTQSDVR